MIDYIILGFLMQQEMTGYTIKKFMENSTAYFYDASYGSIYPSLKRLEGKQWIQMREVTDGNKSKKVYSLLEAGRHSFLTWLDAPLPGGCSSQEPLLRIFFIGHLPQEQIVFRLREYQQTMTREIAALQEVEKTIPAVAHFFQRATLDFGIQYYSFVKDWCEAILCQVELVEPEQTS